MSARSGSRVVVLACAGMFFLGGCSRSLSDLEDYKADVLARPGRPIDPLPPITPYTPYLYQSAASNSRDPFVSFMQTRRENVAKSNLVATGQQKYVDEMLTHVAEELENFPLDALRMVGTLEKDEQRYGIVRDPSGAVHRVQVGNYLGTNFGKIMSIQDTQIELREIQQDSQGRWEERQASLALSE